MKKVCDSSFLSEEETECGLSFLRGREAEYDPSFPAIRDCDRIFWIRSRFRNRKRKIDSRRRVLKRAAVKNFSVWARRTLIGEIRESRGAQHLKDADVEKIAYTWFHRLITVRILEENGSLPIKMSLFSSTDPRETLPDAVRSPFECGLLLSSREKEQLYSLIFSGDMDGIFRLLFFHLCHDLHDRFPELFPAASDPLEKYFSPHVTDKGSLVRRLARDIPGDAFGLGQHGNADILGWIYEDYESEKKQRAYARLRKKKYIGPELSAAVSGECTPSWIARFLAESALEHISREKKTRDSGSGKWPEEIRILDPCAGSGTMLLAAFDVLMSYYIQEGYTASAAAQLILRKNLTGFELNERAAQICRIALILKARSYAPELSGDSCRVNIGVPFGGSGLTKEMEDFVADGNEEIRDALTALFSDLGEAERLGSLCRVRADDLTVLEERLRGIRDAFYETIFEQYDQRLVKECVEPLLREADILGGSYDLVLAHPACLQLSELERDFAETLEKSYPGAGLGSAFLARGLELTNENGLLAVLTEDAPFFRASYAEFRTELLRKELMCMLHLGEREKSDGSCQTAVLIRNRETSHFSGEYIRLTDLHTDSEQERAMRSPSRRYVKDQAEFSGLPGSPCAYWLSEKMIRAYAESELQGETENLLWETVPAGSSACFPYAYDPAGSADRRLPEGEDKRWLLAYVNSRVFREWREVYRISGSVTPQDRERIPVPKLPDAEKREASELAAECLQLVKEDRDSGELSPEFQRHPMLGGYHETAEEAYRAWRTECHVRFVRLRENEEKLNRLFLEHYGLEIPAEVPESEVAVHRIYDTAAEASGDMQCSPYLMTKQTAVRSFLQYAVGCMFGRYSLDTPGIIYDGGIWDSRKYRSYRPVQANCLPVPADAIAGGEILLELERFLSAIYGRDRLPENLEFLANALGGEGEPEQVLRTYFCRDFYRDHLEVFGQKPLYVLFSSGRKCGFRALSYVYRWKRDTVGQVLFEARRNREQMQRSAERLAESTRSARDAAEKARAVRQIDLLRKRCAELDAYEALLREGALASREFRLSESIRRNHARFQKDRKGRKMKLLEELR